MLEELRKKLWEAKYLTPVWPTELIETVKEPGYTGINFKPNNDGLEAEISFIDNGQLCFAYYIFDKENHLQHAYILEDGIKTVIYDRKELVMSIMNEIILYKTESQVVTA